MRNLCLGLIIVVSGVCVKVSAQQPALVLQDDSREPCRQFKMRVLIPADKSTLELSARKPSQSVDPRMVFNPCPKNNENLAVERIEPKLDNGNNYVLFDLETPKRKLRSLLLNPSKPLKADQKPVKSP